MAKNKDYDGNIVAKEFNKLTLEMQITVYHSLGEWLHKKISEHRIKLSEEDKLFEEASKTLKTNTISK